MNGKQRINDCHIADFGVYFYQFTCTVVGVIWMSFAIRDFWVGNVCKIFGVGDR